MKPGRPPSREEFRREILSALARYQYPATVSTIKDMLDARRMHPCAWDTVQKYLHELVAEQLVCRQVLPTERGRRPLVVYVGLSSPRSVARDFLGTFSAD